MNEATIKKKIGFSPGEKVNKNRQSRLAQFELLFIANQQGLVSSDINRPYLRQNALFISRDTYVNYAPDYYKFVVNFLTSYYGARNLFIYILVLRTTYSRLSRRQCNVEDKARCIHMSRVIYSITNCQIWVTYYNRLFDERGGE